MSKTKSDMRSRIDKMLVIIFLLFCMDSVYYSMDLMTCLFQFYRCAVLVTILMDSLVV